MNKIIVFNMIMLFLVSCTSFEQEVQKTKEFHEEQKESKDFVGFYSSIERNYKYDAEEYYSHEFRYGINIKKQQMDTISINKIGADWNYMSNWHIYLCIVDKNKNLFWYRGWGNENNAIPVDFNFPFGGSGLAMVYYNPEEYVPEKSFVNHGELVKNCGAYFVEHGVDDRFNLFRFEIPEITEKFIEKFKKKEEEDCFWWARSVHDIVNQHIELMFLNSTPRKYSKKTCCEIYTGEFDDSITQKCKDLGII